MWPVKIRQILDRSGLYLSTKNIYRSILHRDTITECRILATHYKKFITPGDLCFDIGANIGLKTEALLLAGARVVAVEPQARCVEELHRMFRREPRVEVVANAVGAAQGAANIYESPAHQLSSLSPEFIATAKATRYHADNRWNHSVTIEVTTLDQLIASFGLPIFCKIDVEGYEFEVLKGLSHAIPVVAFEYHPWYAQTAVNCVNKLESLGACYFNWIVGESQEFRSQEWLSANDIIRTLLQGDTENREDFGDIYAASRLTVRRG